MSPTIQAMLAELRERVYLRIDQYIEHALREHDRRVETARRSTGQTFRWAGRK